MKWFPHSLLNRVFFLISLATMLFIVSGMLMFYRAQFIEQIDSAQNTASMLTEVAAQAVEESALIGDYDTVKRTLAKLLASPEFQIAQFIDMTGSVIQVEAGAPQDAFAPAWLRELITEHIFDVNRNISVGGKDYGVMRLGFDIDLIANNLWRLMLQSAMMAGVFMLAILLIIRTFLKRWLGNLDHLQSYQQQVLSGEIDARASAGSDAPTEIRKAFEIVNRTATSLRDQFGQRIDSLMNTLIQHKNAMDEAAIVVELDRAGRITYVNEHFLRASGRTRTELLNMPLDMVGDRDAEGSWIWQPYDAVWQGEICIRYSDGRSSWYQRTIVPITDGIGAIEKYICIDIDISARKGSEQAMASHAKRQSLIARLGKEMLGTDDTTALWKKAIEIATQGLPQQSCAGIGLDREAACVRLIAGTGRLSQCVSADFGHAGDPCWPLLSSGEFHALDSQACMKLTQTWRLSIHAAPHSGAHVPVRSSSHHRGVLAAYCYNEHKFSDDEINFLWSVANMLAAALEAQEATARLTYMAQFDTLTGLPNRTRLMSGMQEVLTHVRQHGTKAGVMFIDLDRFKTVNDTLGHSAGDLLLVQAARRLCESVRCGDIVARLSGDEFAVVLTDLLRSEDANAVAQQIITTLEQPFELNGHQAYISASVGIAIYPDDGKEAGNLIQCADTAMYEAKRAGRNAYQVYLPHMNEEALARMQLETRLREALPRQELHLYYQPKVSLASGAISGFEALLRWSPAKRGMVMPDEFIPILEDTGLIVPVGEWVVRTVCEQLTTWRQAGAPMRPVAINLSARQFQQPDMAARIGAIISTSGIDPELIEFELTESMLMVDSEAAAHTLHKLKSLGVRLSIDDFGTGYSSLAYLKRFPLDKLKIDKTFVSDVHPDADDVAITRAIISLAHNLNLTVVAEGVETSEQLDLLIDNGCDEIQGYYFSHPVKGTECARMLEQDKKLDTSTWKKRQHERVARAGAAGSKLKIVR